MSDTELKPCPFCGGEANISVDSEGTRDTKGRKWAFTVVCVSCCATSGLCFSQEQAIEAWNTRKPMERIVEQLENERAIAFVTLANASDISEMVYEKVPQYLDKAIEIIKKEGTE